MTQAPPAVFKIPTKSPQPARGRAAAPRRARGEGQPARRPRRVLASGTGRAATRGGGEVIELELRDHGVPGPRRKAAGGGRSGTRTASGSSARRRPRTSWPRSWRRSPSGSQAGRAEHDDGPARTSSPTTWTPTGSRSSERWSRKHADTQRRLCERFAAPVIDAVTCQDIKTSHTQKIVNAAPTAGEGDRVQRMISALVSAGIDGGVPGQPAAGEGALAGRGPAAARARR